MIALRCALSFGAIALSSHAFAAEVRFQDLMTQCAACHGVDGIARDVEVPNLAGQHDRYLFNQLQAFRSGKRTHKEMRYMSRQLTDEEMTAVSQYYSNMPH